MTAPQDCEIGQKGMWLNLGPTTHFRLIDVGEMQWSVERLVNSCSIVGSSFGGFLALFLPEENATLGMSRQFQGKIEIYTSLGSRVGECGTIELGSGARVFFVGWNESENYLVVVLHSGEIRFLHVNGELAASTIFLPLPPTKVISTGNGIIGVLRGGDALFVALVKREENRGYSVVTLDVSHLLLVHDMILPLLGIHSSEQTQVYLFYPTEENTTNASCCYFPRTGPPVVKEMSVSLEGIVDKAVFSPNGERVALRTTDGVIYVGSTNFEEVVVVHVANTSMPEKVFMRSPLPSDAPLLFCGNDAVFFADWDEGYSNDDDLGDKRKTTASFSFSLSATDGSSEVDLSDDIPSDSFFFPECDGIRIASCTRCLFLQIITPEVQRVCAVGSTAPGAVLRSAYEGFSSGNAAAVRAIHELQQSLPSLVEAIDDCIRTAAFEWDIESQQHFLRTASFGKSFARQYDADFFVSMATKIRVRNTLKTVAKMIISHEQLQQLGAHQLARRLLRSGNHSLVWRVCTCLHCVRDDILSEWMLSKLAYELAHQKKEEDAARELVSFLKQSGGNGSVSRGFHKTPKSLPEIPFSELASVAQINGKRAAAFVLLDAEEVPTRQVPMLLAFGEPEKALVRAVAASDSDLIFTVIQYMLRAGGSAKDVQFIANYPDARDLLLVYISVCPHYRHYLRDYFLAHPTVEQYLEVRDYLGVDRRLRQRIEEKIASIDDLCITLQKRKSEILQKLPLLVGSSGETEPKKHAGGIPLGLGPSTGSISSTTGGGGNSATAGSSSGGGGALGGKISERYLCLQIGLVEKQTQFAKTYRDERFLTASVADMLYYLLTRGEDKATEEAMALRREYNVPEDMMQWARLKAFAATSRWEEVDKMGGINTRQKPVLSGEALVSLLLSYDRPEQASKHIPRIQKLEERLEYYVQCGSWEAAGEDCGRAGATELLEQLQARARGSTVAQEQIKKGWDMAVGASSGITFGKLFS